MKLSSDAHDTALGSHSEDRAPIMRAHRQRSQHSQISSLAATTFVTGVILLKKTVAFERVMWRAMRGNVIIRTVGLPNPINNGENGKNKSNEERRSAFIIFCHGMETTDRVRKMCVAMGCRLVEVPEDHSGRATRYSDLVTKIDDIQSILYNSKQALHDEMNKISEGLEDWLVSVRREKAIYTVLNMFSSNTTLSQATSQEDSNLNLFSTENTAIGNSSIGSKIRGVGGLVGEAWVPTQLLPAVDEAVKRASSLAGLYAAVPTIITPLPVSGSSALSMPTYFPTTPMTAAFQDMTDAYGIPRYGEINPTLFMLASFPFLFAVMFGDVGHGFIMLSIGLFLCIFERRLSGKAVREEMFGMLYSGRYILVLMGAASVFAGSVYNDFFARSIAIFPSAYTLDKMTGVVSREGKRVYPFGIDPIWNQATNSLSLTNSYKMKQSILFGIIQMSFGLLLGAANHLTNRDYLSLFGSFLPQLLFFCSLFGYLGFLIVYKWIWPKDISLIIVFINMVLGFGKVEGESLFPGQATIQFILVCVAILCIPWMLLSQPGWMLWRKATKKMSGYEETTIITDSHQVHNSDEEDSIGDCFMFSMIHTIEFVLSSVSNTASYLRLWALSLAHAQLSEVLWEMVLEKTMRNGLILVLGFAAWFTLTVSIMVIMEGLSAFLHALRLHWVEFNNKFYSGSGVKFAPLKTSDSDLITGIIEEGLI